MGRFFTIFAAVASFALPAPVFAEQLHADYDPEGVIEYVTSFKERCDGVVLQTQHMVGDESTGSTVLLIPGPDTMIYGAFEHGEVLEFGYLDQSPIYNEDSRFDWSAWVDEQLTNSGYAPWFGAQIACML